MRTSKLDAPHQCRDALKAILIEVWIARVLANHTQNSDQLGKDSNEVGCERLTGGDNHAHNTYSPRRKVLSAKLAYNSHFIK